MKIKVLAFASLADAWGRKEAVLDLNKDSLVIRDVVDIILGGRSDLEHYRAVLRVARNGEFADDATPLRDGDEVAVFPPVSGGAR